MKYILFLFLFATPLIAENYWSTTYNKLTPPAGAEHLQKLFTMANPAVVNIATVKSSDAANANQQSLGTGFMIREDGYLLTNDHVVSKSERIEVIDHRGKHYQAKLIGSDSFVDLALMKIDSSEKFTILGFGESASAKIGEWVVAIGNPFGFNNTMTQGIVSAKGRVISTEPSHKRFDDFLQIDAAINPGNSGGPLLNLMGEVIGINTAITANGSGVAFSIPIDVVKSILPLLYKKGKAERGWIGIVAKAMVGKKQPVLTVIEVVIGSPAARAGVRANDEIIQIDGKSLKSLEQLSDMLLAATPGSNMKLRLKRQGQQQVVNIIVGDLSTIH